MTETEPGYTTISMAEDAVKAATPCFKRWKWVQEVFVVLNLDTQHRVIGKPCITAVGGLTSVETWPRDVFREAIKKSAAAVILLHNHPSGDVDPSGQDLDLTARMSEAGRLLGIPVLDHIIVAKSGKYISLAARGKL